MQEHDGPRPQMNPETPRRAAQNALRGLPIVLKYLDLRDEVLGKETEPEEPQDPPKGRVRRVAGRVGRAIKREAKVLRKLHTTDIPEHLGRELFRSRTRTRPVSQDPLDNDK